MDDRRYRAFLRARYRVLFGYLGDACVAVALVIFAPLAAAPLFPEDAATARALLGTGIATALAGIALGAGRRGAPRESLNLQEGSVLVVFCWLAAILAGAVPFLFLEGVTPVQAIFESTSGWTTTGLSIVDVETAPRLLLLYRSTLQLAGGAGFAVIVLSSLGGPTGTGLGTAEGRGDLLVPNMRRSARLVLVLYATYAAVGILGLRVVGMGWFDATNHAFAAISTGGFSTRGASLGAWDSPAVEGVTLGLMLAGTTNFATAWTLVRGRWGAVARNGEVRLLTVLLAAGSAALFLGVTGSLYATLGKALRVAIFETASAITTTGFQTVGYGDWPPLGYAVLVLLMIVGGGTGSTAGGLKLYRVYALWRAFLGEIRRMIRPADAALPDVWVGDRRRFLGDAELRSIGVFLFLYVATLGLGAAGLAASGYGLRDALFEAASALGTVGLSCGLTGPGTPSGPLALMTALMLLGRLEILVLALFAVKAARHLRALLLP